MTNWQLIITLATLVLAIFGANSLSQQAMNKRIDDLKSYLDARFQAVEAEFKGVRAEMANQAIRSDRVERQLEAIFKPVFPKSGD